MTAWEQSRSQDSSRWISREFSELLQELEAADQSQAARGHDFDLLIIGSGYGGAMAADVLSGGSDSEGNPLRIALLERGLEYLPGSFPSRTADLPGHLRFSAGNRRRGGKGLFDIRAGAEVNVVLANGLGGGSLINAGVMEIPDARIFDSRWPQALQQATALQPYYTRAQALLGSTLAGTRNTITRHAQCDPGGLPKTQVLKQLPASSASGSEPAFHEAAITVAMRDQATVAGVKLKACNLCGDCATGCNYSAKESLDTNLLVRAHRRGTRIYCGATVLRIEPLPAGLGGWRVLVTHTDEGRRVCEGGARWISTGKLILSAGTLGSTEILQRSARSSKNLPLSKRLGHRFSTNGDNLIFGYDLKHPANAMAREDTAPDQRHVGPTITGVIRTQAGTESPRKLFTIEELAVPGSLRRFAEESVSTAAFVGSFMSFERKRHEAGMPAQDPYAVQPEKIQRTSIFATMGDDDAAGRLYLDAARDLGDADGYLQVEWPGIRQHPLFERTTDQLKALVAKAGLQGAVLANPLWRPLGGLGEIGDELRGPVTTVHPLGGCAMGDQVEDGVVNEFGQVFDAKTGLAHPDLVVLDGAIVPSALATNPALTIAALALRAAEQLQRLWQWQAPAQALPAVDVARPVTFDMAAEITRRAQSDVATRINIEERLAGSAYLLDEQNRPIECWLEATLVYPDQDLQQLMRTDGDGRLSHAVVKLGPPGDRQGSRLRVFRKSDFVGADGSAAAWDRLRFGDLSADERKTLAEPCANTYALSGTLTLFEREASGWCWRTARGLLSYVRNRGLRDLFQWLQARIGSGGGGIQHGFLKSLLALANRAGETRLFRYELQLEDPYHEHFKLRPAAAGDRRLSGLKKIRYTRASSPWRQLMELPLDALPFALSGQHRKPVLCLDMRFLAARQIALLGISAQSDQVRALLDLGSLTAYLARMLVSIHAWALRKPDAPRDRRIQRLPGTLPGLPPPQIFTLPVDELNGQPVSIRLTRYCDDRNEPGSQADVDDPCPLVLIHGYSASGTTFAHPALDPGLASYFAKRRHRVWVVDLRSSCGLDTASHPWTFERIALTDIPVAVDHICRFEQSAQVNVVAHCMGAAMLGMAVLTAEMTPTELQQKIYTTRDHDVQDRFSAERAALPGRLRRVVLSQVGPAPVMRSENIFRAYIASFIQAIVGPLRYSFRPDPSQPWMLKLLDYLAATLPYPKEELRQEQSSIPWRRQDDLGTRHRMDLIYGRTFRLANLSTAVRGAIDDFFGPINLDTVAQVLFFSLAHLITNRDGRNNFVTLQHLRKHWRFSTLSIHGDQNGLVDRSTAYRMYTTLREAGCPVEPPVILEGFGHQDCLIGRNAARVFERMETFFSAQERQTPRTGSAPDICAEPPWLGPTLLVDDDPQRIGQLRIGIGTHPEFGAPSHYCLRAMQSGPAQSWLPQLGTDAPGITAPLPRSEHPNWFAVPLPDGCLAPGITHVGVFLIYSQSARTVGPTLSPGSGTPLSGKLKLPGRLFGQLTRRLRLGGKLAPAAGPSHADEAPALPDFKLDGLRAAPTPTAIDEAILKACARLTRKARWTPMQVEPEGFLVHPARHEQRQQPLDSIRIALGSCQYAPGVLDRAVAFASWRALSNHIQSCDDGEPASRHRLPDLLVLAGDQVYTDASAGLFDPTRRSDRYRLPYQAWLSAPEVRDIMRRVPAATMLDDHEIQDNWEPLPAPVWASALQWEALPQACLEQAARRRHDSVLSGTKAFLAYQRGRIDAGSRKRPCDFSFSWRGVPVFMLDSRRQRLPRTALSVSQADILGPQQLARLKQWLKEQPADRPKLLVAPALMLPRHRSAVPAQLDFGHQDQGSSAALHSDAFDGYPASYFELLSFIVDEGITRLVLLSGDEHLGLASQATLRSEKTGKTATLHSVHSPSLYAPFPFANATRADFICDETFTFSPAAADAPVYTCTVKTELFDGPGFLVVDLQRKEDEPGWLLSCQKVDASGALIEVLQARDL